MIAVLDLQLQFNFLKDVVYLVCSATVTAKAAPLCDGKQSCDVPIVPLKSLNIDEVISVKNNCPIDGELIKLVKVNFMQVKFKCQGWFITRS